jgi:hypothetical protein
MAFFASIDDLPGARTSWKDKPPTDPEPPVVIPDPPRQKPRGIAIDWRCEIKDKILVTDENKVPLLWTCDAALRSDGKHHLLGSQVLTYAEYISKPVSVAIDNVSVPIKPVYDNKQAKAYVVENYKDNP